MRVGLLGRKVGMTQIYEAERHRRPGHRPGMRPLHRAPGPDRGARRLPRRAARLRRQEAEERHPGRARPRQARSTPSPSASSARSARTAPTDGVAEGQTLTVEVFNEIKRVDVIGTSKGRGFSGVIKRHGFKGLRATHGVKRMHRHPGSSGPSADPARTRKGIRKPGQYGNARITVRNLQVVRVDPTNNLLLVRGAVPGPNGGFLTVRQTNKV